MKEINDVVIVGAGPAGLSAAIYLANNGINPIVLERGVYPGSKNMFGGVVYGQILNKIIPNYLDTVPIERLITKRRISFLSTDSSFSIEHFDDSHRLPPYNGFTVMRPVFDKWLATEAEKAGARIYNGVTVSGVNYVNNIVKLEIDNGAEYIYANTLIAADGVNSVIARKGGFRSSFPETEVSLGVKETLYLPKNDIEKRFKLDGNEGIANEFVGFSMNGVNGGGFLYTNSDSISIGIIAQIASLKKNAISPAELLENFKGHKFIDPMIKGARTAEYSAHLIPEGGYKALPKLFGKRTILAGDAAGFVLNTGINLEGVNYAIASGIAAGKTIQNAFLKNDFTDASFSYYSKYLDEYNVLNNLKMFKNAVNIINNPRLHRLYPDLINSIAKFMLNGNDNIKVRYRHVLHKFYVKRIGYKNIIKDAYNVFKGLF